MGTLMTVLAFGTMGAVAVFAYINARATERLKHDKTHKPSTMCVNSAHWQAARR